MAGGASLARDIRERVTRYDGQMATKAIATGRLRDPAGCPRPIDNLHHKVEPIRDTPPIDFIIEKKRSPHDPNKRRAWICDHMGTCLLFQATEHHVRPRVAAGRCGGFPISKAGIAARNGFTGLIGVFGNKRHKSPRVTGMAAGQGGNCRSSRGRNSAKTLMMAFVRSLRSDPMDHAIAPSLRSLSVITNSYRTSTLFFILYLPGGHSGFSSGHRGDDRCRPIDVHRGRSGRYLLPAIVSPPSSIANWHVTRR
jgi:hypothetical protein